MSKDVKYIVAYSIGLGFFSYHAVGPRGCNGAVSDLLKVKPEVKDKSRKEQTRKDKGEI